MLWLSLQVTGRQSSSGDWGKLPNLSCVLLEKLLLWRLSMGEQVGAEQKTHDLIKNLRGATSGDKPPHQVIDELLCFSWWG